MDKHDKEVVGEIKLRWPGAAPNSSAEPPPFRLRPPVRGAAVAIIQNMESRKTPMGQAKIASRQQVAYATLESSSPERLIANVLSARSASLVCWDRTRLVGRITAH